MPITRGVGRDGMELEWKSWSLILPSPTKHYGHLAPLCRHTFVGRLRHPASPVGPPSRLYAFWAASRPGLIAVVCSIRADLVGLQASPLLVGSPSILAHAHRLFLPKLASLLLEGKYSSGLC